MVTNTLMSLEALKEILTPFLPEIRGRKRDLNSRDRYKELVKLRIIYSVIASKMGHTTVKIGKQLRKNRTSILH